jgi:hypothetical protein
MAGLLQILAGLTVTVLVLTPAALGIQSKYSAIRAFPRYPDGDGVSSDHYCLLVGRWLEGA